MAVDGHNNTQRNEPPPVDRAEFDELIARYYPDG